MKKPIFVLILALFAATFTIGGCGHKAPGPSGATFTGLLLEPESILLSIGEEKQFSIKGLVAASDSSNVISWSVVGGIGTIDATGLFCATAEGVGTIEASIGEVKGRSNVQVVEGKTVSGKITDAVSGKPISGAVIYSCGKEAISNSSGNYILSGLPLTAESVTVISPGYPALTVVSTSNVINLELTILGPINLSGEDNSFVRLTCSNESGSPTNSVFWTLIKNGHSSSGKAGGEVMTFPVYVDKDHSGTDHYLYFWTNQQLNGKLIKAPLSANTTNDLGHIDLSPCSASITGEVAGENTYAWKSLGVGIMNNGRREPMPLFMTSVLSDSDYSQNLPPSNDDIKYYVKAFAFCGKAPYWEGKKIEVFVENIEIAPGEAKKIDLFFPRLITEMSPEDNSTVGRNPTFSWVSPDPKYNLFMVMLLEPGSSLVVKWQGITSKDSIAFPDLPGETLTPGRQYEWMVVGYYIPGLTDYARSGVKMYSMADGAVKSSENTSGGNISSYMAPYINQYTEKTISTPRRIII